MARDDSEGVPGPDVLLTPAQMAAADAASAVPVATLMAAAGLAVSRAVAARWSPRRVLVLAGPGNNGGDGWVAARWLERRGWPVAVALLAPPRPGPAAEAAAAWRGPVVPLDAREAARAGLVLDALLGAAPARPLPPGAVAALRASGGPVVAVDVPSGLDGATGRALGEVAAAALTVTFARLKPGHLLMPGRRLCGEVVLSDIGLPAAALRVGLAGAPPLWRNHPRLWRLPVLDPAGHKYSRGHVVVAGGGAMAGAARLAASAARRAGAGLVTLAATDEAGAAAFRAGEPGWIVAGPPAGAALEDDRRDPWLIGPGLPADGATRSLLGAALAAGRRVVADAGALSAFAGAAEGLRGVALVTPHEGEFARLFGPVGADRVAAARAAAARLGAVVLLKGPDTVVAAPDGRAAIQDASPPSLATAGTGDVLAGVAAALIGQGMAPFEAGCAAAWLQGAAAPEGPGVVAEDVVAGLPGAWRAAEAAAAGG